MIGGMLSEMQEKKIKAKNESGSELWGEKKAK